MRRLPVSQWPSQHWKLGILAGSLVPFHSFFQGSVWNNRKSQNEKNLYFGQVAELDVF